MTRSPATLTRYREKRDFSRTPEPAGKVHRPGQALSFVVQRHAARRLHYDLRLEWHGVMKSWAVTRGPSLDPADKRLAVEVEDHPIDYNSFEGTIPKPDYGGGTVQIWDRGTWAPLDPDTVDKDLTKGELKFVLAGERLNGGFVLVRMKPRRGESDKHHNWLLIKERDSAATPGAGDAVLHADTSVVSGRTMDEIAEAAGEGEATEKPRSAKRSAGTKRVRATTTGKVGATRTGKAGATKTGKAGATTTGKKSAASRSASAKAAAVSAEVRRTAPEKTRSRSTAIPRFIAPQLCKLMDTPPTGTTWVHELKLDGYRLQLRVEAGQPVLRTRTGLDWTERFPSIAKAAAALPDCLMDGEVVALDAKGHPSFAALQATLAGEQDAPIVYFVFDLLHDGHRDLRNEPLETRKRLLQPMVPEGETVLRYLDHFAGPGAAVLGSACELGMEGVVSKRLDGRYVSGRGDGWTKAKCRGRDEFLIGGWTRDKKGRGLGALLVGAHRDGQFVYLGRVGTGFSAALSDDLVRRLTPLRTSTSPFIGRQPARTSDVNWASPQLVAEVAYGGWTEAEGLLRHPSFLGLREDKPAAEVTSPDAPAKPEADPPAKSASRSADPPAKRSGSLTISHPDRVLWPATKSTQAVTKADLAAYYAKFADRILEYIGGRPLTVARAP
ncbi:MAG TPA: non-homologous end-joining DNA ligase, partial [Acetobacteraceae bacterium]|nr:non-homologous end-joining DNA ligase [Acetobacteraceae bacterium]